MAVAPRPEWQTPAATWVEIIDRYVTYIQVPAWRVNAFTRNGDKTRPCVPAAEAKLLRTNMLRALEGIARRRSVSTKECIATRDDLRGLLQLQGRHISKSERCPQEVHRQLQRALLLNESGYACVYCHRTAWGVYAEHAAKEPPRTLRFEIDHRTPKRKKTDEDDLKSGNLVVACRSCNTIKGEMDESRFVHELQSLAGAVHRMAQSKQ